MKKATTRDKAVKIGGHSWNSATALHSPCALYRASYALYARHRASYSRPLSACTSVQNFAVPLLPLKKQSHSCCRCREKENTHRYSTTNSIYRHGALERRANCVRSQNALHSALSATSVVENAVADFTGFVTKPTLNATTQ